MCIKNSLFFNFGRMKNYCRNNFLENYNLLCFSFVSFIRFAKKL